MKQASKLLLLITVVVIITSSCDQNTSKKESQLVPQTLIEIPLDGPITKKKAELSGMAWLDEDTLVLLPQYPDVFGTPGILFTISKQAILDYLDHKSVEPILPGMIILDMPNFRDMIPDYEGFEAIEFHDKNIYLTIESGKGNHMMGYLISGVVSANNKEIQIDASQMTKIPPPIQLDNRTDEALLIDQGKIYTFFEANGASINSYPVAHVFDLNLNALGTVSFPHLEFRVTDTAMGTDDGIWVINQISQKDIDILPQFDPLSNTSPQVTSSATFMHVERLVKLNLDGKGFTIADFPPIQIKLGDTPRNWEGLAILDNRGFLLVTDKSPDTILGFVQMP